MLLQRWPHAAGPFALHESRRHSGGYITPAFSGTHKWADLLGNPCGLRGPQRGDKIRSGYITPAFSEVPIVGKNQSGYITPAFSWAHKWAELLRNPCVQRVPRKGDELRNGYITPTFSGAHKWAYFLRHLCVLWSPQRGDKIRSGHMTAWPTSGRNCYATPALSGPGPWDKIRIGYITLPSQGPKSGRNCYVTPALLRIPRRGDKTKSDYITLTFSQGPKAGGIAK